MSGTIRNGERRPVRFGAVQCASAGVTERAGMTEVAFVAPIARLRGVKEGTIDGEPWRVVEVRESEHVPGMVVLTVEPAGDASR